MFTHTADIILGKSDDFTNLSTFGIMRGISRHYIRQIVSRLTILGHIHDDGYLSVTSKANEVLFADAHVTIRGERSESKEKIKKEKSHKKARTYAVSENLLAKLKQLRSEIAGEEKVPAFVIFSDATLIDMCILHPKNKEEFLEVNGIGQVKLNRYGNRFLEILKTEKPVEASENPLPEFTPEALREQVEIENDTIYISRIADNINVVLIQYGKPKVTGAALNRLLIGARYLKLVDNIKLPTSTGQSNGIITIERISDRGTTYTQCLFNAEAQRICIELALSEIICE